MAREKRVVVVVVHPLTSCSCVLRMLPLAVACRSQFGRCILKVCRLLLWLFAASGKAAPVTAWQEDDLKGTSSLGSQVEYELDEGLISFGSCLERGQYAKAGMNEQGEDRFEGLPRGSLAAQ